MSVSIPIYIYSSCISYFVTSHSSISINANSYIDKYSSLYKRVFILHWITTSPLAFTKMFGPQMVEKPCSTRLGESCGFTISYFILLGPGSTYRGINSLLQASLLHWVLCLMLLLALTKFRGHLQSVYKLLRDTLRKVGIYVSMPKMRWRAHSRAVR